nr:hypothetical protein [Rhodococcus erythropolis]
MTWRIPLFTNNSDPGEDPGFAPPESWAQALAAVAQDLRCLRFGAEVVVDRLIWTKLAGYDFVQWPSRGRHLLVPRLRDGEPVWMDPHGDATISRIGELCKNSTNYAAT